MSNEDYFIDSHCHLFNVMDVSITALLSRFIDKDMMKFYPALAVPGVALVTAATKVKEAPGQRALRNSRDPSALPRVGSHRVWGANRSGGSTSAGRRLRTR